MKETGKSRQLCGGEKISKKVNGFSLGKRIEEKAQPKIRILRRIHMKKH